MPSSQVLHAWGHLEREPQLVYLNKDGKEVECHAVTRSRTLHGPTPYREKAVYLGEVTTFVRRLRPANPTLRVPPEHIETLDDA